MKRKLLVFAATIVVAMFVFGIAVASGTYQVVIVKGDGPATIPFNSGEEMKFDFSDSVEIPSGIVSNNGFSFSFDGGKTVVDAKKSAKDVQYRIPFTVTNKTAVALIDGSASVVISATESVTMSVTVSALSGAGGSKVSSVKKLPEPTTIKDEFVEMGNAGEGGKVTVKVEDASVLLEFYSQGKFDSQTLMVRNLTPWFYAGVSVAAGDYSYTITPTLKGQFIGLRAKVTASGTVAKVTVTLPAAPSATTTSAPAASAKPGSTTSAPPTTAAKPGSTTPPDATPAATTCPPGVDHCGPGGPGDTIPWYKTLWMNILRALPWN